MVYVYEAATTHLQSIHVIVFAIFRCVFMFLENRINFVREEQNNYFIDR